METLDIAYKGSNLEFRRGPEVLGSVRDVSKASLYSNEDAELPYFTVYISTELPEPENSVFDGLVSKRAITKYSKFLDGNYYGVLLELENRDYRISVKHVKDEEENHEEIIVE